MKRLSLNAKSLILAGSAFAVLAGLAMPSQAKVMSAAEFLASIEEAKYICKRLDEPFWMAKRQYGCGDQITCRSSGKCHTAKKKRHPNDPPIGVVVRVLPLEDGKNGDGAQSPDRSDKGKGNGPNNPGGHIH